MPKIPSLPPMTSPDTADELPIEDVSASTTKYITLTKLKEWFQSLSGWISTAMLAAGAVTDTKRTLNSAFRASADGSQGALTSATFIKLTYKTEVFDDNSDYDAANSKFVAPRDGKYAFQWQWQTSGDTAILSMLYKNGASLHRGLWADATGNNRSSNGSVTLKLVAGDYIEIYGYSTGSSRVPRPGDYSNFSGFFIGI
jgi:hypothetical protein